ncbi:hypothetical protein Y1Q_0021455 [Alligator mississippiensis]|uniref:Reverse transcriptase RNase H-like domain-containing protein n=1 Tax=Alligator mississippiensis TaxID=8496 RepID=A0A151P9Z1_ALLMI|nr:hypothetical protein Y1Q_0021455 [Alligator mississippiensis]
MKCCSGNWMDTSEITIDAILTQEDSGLERLIAYASRKLLPAETWRRGGRHAAPAPDSNTVCELRLLTAQLGMGR